MYYRYKAGPPTRQQKEWIADLGYNGELPSNAYKAEVLLRELQSKSSVSNAQMDYLYSLGAIVIPATMLEAHNLIEVLLRERMVKNDPEFITIRQYEFLYEHDFDVSWDMTKLQASDAISYIAQESKRTWERRCNEWEIECERDEQNRVRRQIYTEVKKMLRCPSCDAKVKVTKVDKHLHYVCDACRSESDFNQTSKKMELIAEYHEEPANIVVENIPEENKVDVYFKLIKDIVYDLVVTDDELTSARKLREQLNLSTEQLRAAHAKIYARILAIYSQDDWVDERETKIIALLYKCLATLGWAPGQYIPSQH